jgi:hypothetical protein
MLDTTSCGSMTFIVDANYAFLFADDMKFISCTVHHHGGAG